MILEVRNEIAGRLRAEGKNCAQATLAPFSKELGIDEQTLLQMTAALGSGVAATGEICGVPNAIAIARGIICSKLQKSKGETTADARKYVDQFVNQNGALRCRDLKGRPGCATCNQLIANGIEILHKSFEKE